MDFLDLQLFVKIVEKKGLGAAGRELGLSPSSVSERLVNLEKHLGTTLVHRTTRAISLTEEGRTFVEGARRLLAEARELETNIKTGTLELVGPIRLTAPEDLGRQFIAPLVGRFLHEHPGVTIDLYLTDGYIDLVAQGIDFGVRYGVLADSTLKARTLGRSRRVVVASPTYLKKRGRPTHPEQLAEHDCLLMRFGQTPDDQWRFEIDGKSRAFPVRGRCVANDGGVIRQLCVEGYGIAFKSNWDIEADLLAGSLVELLCEYTPSPIALQMVYPSVLRQPKRVRLLMDAIAERLGGASGR